MDLFVYSNYTLDLNGMVDYPYSTLEGATLIPDIISVTWIERYLEPGEFSFTVPLDSNAQSLCPLGSIISQVEGQETMIVENHEIVEDKDRQMTLTVSGRSFQVLLENRVIGQDGRQDQYFGTLTTNLTGYYSATISPHAGARWGNWGGKYAHIDTNYMRKSDIVEYVVNRLFGTQEAIYANQGATHDLSPGYPRVPSVIYPYTYPNADTINFLVFINYNSKPIPETYIAFSYPLSNEDAHKAVVDILATESMGIKTQRAGLTSPIDFNGTGIPHPWPDDYKNKLALIVYYANDRREAVQFSYEGGDVDKATYLWSNKGEKNSYFSTAQLLGILDRGEIGYKQRTVHVDANDTEDTFVYGTQAPSDTADNDIRVRTNWLRSKGKEALGLKENQRTMIMEANLVSQQKDLIYRRDYDTGDLVTVLGNHGFKETMQVTEYTEIEDERGEISYPTLIVPSQKTISDLEKPVGERI